MSNDVYDRCAPTPPAVDALGADLRRIWDQQPTGLLESVDLLQLALHRAACAATSPALAAGVTFHQIGRGHALVEEAGLLLQQAKALLLGGSATDQAKDQGANSVVT